MRILAVNWLDLENPDAGGAEVHFFEIFGRLVERGHHVTLVTSGFPGCAPRTVIRGITVLRAGGRYSFALKGRGAVRQVLGAGSYDVLVEDINKIPLFLSGLGGLPAYVIVPHLFGATAFREASFPIAAAVWLAEKLIPRAYRRASFQAISESTRDDLVRRGVSRSSIRVIYPGVDTTWFVPDREPRRTGEPSFLYVGRIKRYKGLETAVRAFDIARRSNERMVFNIAGTGDDRRRLERLAASLGLSESVRFLGYVAEDRKRELLRSSWGVVFPSEKEGWGITNVEAAACGTPAVASNSPGLRESVRDGETGLLVEHGNARKLAEAMLRLAGDRELVERLGVGARRFAETLSWDRTASSTEEHILELINGV